MVKGKWKRRLYFGAGAALGGLSRFIPKKKNRICFFCKSGINDNSEALLAYLLREQYPQEYQIFCVVGNVEKYRHYEEKGVRVKGLLPGVWELLRSRYIFCHGENLAVMPTKGQISVNYWHGTPLKKINRMLPKLGDYRYDFFTYTVAAAPMFRPIFAKAFGCEEERVLINGHPRCDYLFREEGALSGLGYQRADYRRIFLWMPTYRQSRDGLIEDTGEENLHNNGIPLFHDERELKELDAFLKERGCLLLLKLHPAQKIQGAKESYENLCLLTNDELDGRRLPLYCLVREADVLLTDYSSVFFDYLLLDRPIGFILEDFGAYEDRRGFVVKNPLDYMPGEKIYQKQELYSFLEKCIREEDGWKEARARVSALVNSGQEKENCKRLLEQIGLVRRQG